MSDLNNLFGNSNSCPAVMSDGRGANTNFKPKNEYFEEIKNKVGAANSLELKNKLKLEDVKEPIDEFLCDSVPHGNVDVSQNIGGLLSTQGGTWRNNFKDLRN